MSILIIPGYKLQFGSLRERGLLIKFMQQAYQELFPQQEDFSHLADTVKRHLAVDTPLWFVEKIQEKEKPSLPFTRRLHPIACLWMGNAIDQVEGDRYSHIFLVYVAPEHRRKGIGSALINYAQDWAQERGDRCISLQVFPHNQAALNLYLRLGYQTQSLQMYKSLKN